jgi:flagellar basal body rod protein FlgG
MEALDMLANNLANAATAGFKADREFYNIYVSAEAQPADATSGPAAMPEVQRLWTDLSQGTITVTGNSLDLAISGQGFFVVNGPAGLLYTRNGSFRLSPQGEVQTQDGYALRAQDGRKIVVDPAFRFDISSDGVVHQNGQEIARLDLADFAVSSALVKRQGNYFQLADPSATAGRPASEVWQGRLEASNVGSAETAVRLVSVMRQFEMLQRAITIGAEMNRRSVEEVARVT